MGVTTVHPAISLMTDKEVAAIFYNYKWCQGKKAGPEHPIHFSTTAKGHLKCYSQKGYTNLHTIMACDLKKNITTSEAIEWHTKQHSCNF